MGRGSGEGPHSVDAQLAYILQAASANMLPQFQCESRRTHALVAGKVCGVKADAAFHQEENFLTLPTLGLAATLGQLEDIRLPHTRGHQD